MSVYLANQFSKIEETRQYAKELRELGVVVTSRWLEEPSDPNHSLKDHSVFQHKEAAIKDRDDLLLAEDFVVFTVDPDALTRRGGRHVETGIALAKGKRVIVCGPHENIFHYLDGVIVCETFDEVKQILQKKG